MPLHIKTQQQRYQAIGSIVKLAQRFSSVPDLAMLKPSEKLDALDLLCNEVLMTKPMRQVLDNRLKEVQTAQHARHRLSLLFARAAKLFVCLTKSFTDIFLLFRLIPRRPDPHSESSEARIQPLGQLRRR